MWNWLKPGLGLKRWLILAVVGAGILSLGLTGLLNVFVPELTGLGIRTYVLTGLGILITIFSLTGLVVTLVGRLYTGGEPLARRLYRRSGFLSGPAVVAFGGGTGLSTLLRGLKQLTWDLTAIVAVTDDGGSSGRLKENFDVPAPGDLRDCLVALAPEEQRLADLFAYRFETGGELEGHSVGNILMTALSDIHGGFPEAIRACSEVLAVQGRVLPAMLGTPELEATVDSGRQVVGETDISRSGELIRDLDITPRPVRTNPEAIAAVSEADLIVVGPGSLYTSILTNFLDQDLCSAVVNSPAPLVYVCNLMTQSGETEGFEVSDHLEVFKEIPPDPIEFDHLLVNTREAPGELRESYRREGSEQVKLDYEALRDFDLEIHARDFLDVGDTLRHDVEAIVNELRKIIGYGW